MKTSNLTPKAKKRWDKIPVGVQTKILENVWCTNCMHGIRIEVESGKMIADGDLLLEGRCNECGAKVVRLIEPEDGLENQI